MNALEWANSDNPGDMLKFLGDIAADGRQTVDDMISHERCLRLFAAACCRHVWRLWRTSSMRAIVTAEQFADGARQIPYVLNEAWRQAQSGAMDEGWVWCVTRGNIAVALRHTIHWHPLDLDRHVQADLLRDIFGHPPRPLNPLWGEGRPCRDCDGKGCHLGSAGDRENPTCRACNGSGVVHGPGPYQTPDVLAMAETAYNDRPDNGLLDRQRLHVLADRMEELGCTDSYLLNHLHGRVVCPSCLGSREGQDNNGYCGNCEAQGWIDMSDEARCVRGCHVLDAILGKRPEWRIRT